MLAGAAGGLRGGLGGGGAGVGAGWAQVSATHLYVRVLALSPQLPSSPRPVCPKPDRALPLASFPGTKQRVNPALRPSASRFRKKAAVSVNNSLVLFVLSGYREP